LGSQLLANAFLDPNDTCGVCHVAYESVFCIYMASHHNGCVSHRIAYGLDVGTYAYLNICLGIHLHMCICIHVNIYIYMFVCSMYISIHFYLYIYTYTYLYVGKDVWTVELSGRLSVCNACIYPQIYVYICIYIYI